MKLKMEQKEQDPTPDYSDEVTEEVKLKFLNFTVNFGKYRGKTWQDVFLTDFNYFKYIVGKMEPHAPATHRVLKEVVKDWQEKIKASQPKTIECERDQFADDEHSDSCSDSMPVPTPKRKAKAKRKTRKKRVTPY